MRAGFGVGYRRSIKPWHQDNALELTATCEPGYFWFDRDSSTGPDFVLPRNTYEGRARLRLRFDALERNIMELGHQGFALGTDLFYAHRAHWQTWGDGSFGVADAAAQRSYTAASL